MEISIDRKKPKKTFWLNTFLSKNGTKNRRYGNLKNRNRDQQKKTSKVREKKTRIFCHPIIKHEKQPSVV